MSENWDLLDVQNDNGQSVFSIRFAGKPKEIHISYLNNYGEMSMAKFDKNGEGIQTVSNMFKMKIVSD